MFHFLRLQQYVAMVNPNAVAKQAPATVSITVTGMALGNGLTSSSIG
jgi:hypothetical protein